MNSFDYALGLFSVLFGLALAGIALSFHKLLRHRRTVRWDGRVIVFSLLVVVVIVRMWFSQWTLRDIGAVLDFPFFLTLFVELMILFLLAASCLPDDPASNCDLGAFYEDQRRTLWTVFAVFQLSFFLHWLYFRGMGSPLSDWTRVLMPLALFVVLIFVRAKWLEYAAPLTVIAIELYANWGRSLS